MRMLLFVGLISVCLFGCDSSYNLDGVRTKKISKEVVAGEYLLKRNSLPKSYQHPSSFVEDSRVILYQDGSYKASFMPEFFVEEFDRDSKSFYVYQSEGQWNIGKRSSAYYIEFSPSVTSRSSIATLDFKEVEVRQMLGLAIVKGQPVNIAINVFTGADASLFTFIRQ